MREMTRDFLFQGVSAVETNALFQEKFGVENSPTLCTIYKWRREHRGGVREANDQNPVEISREDGGGQKANKPYKKDCDKYCVPCNREMSSRHYFELHMLKIHDVFVGDSKALYEVLEAIGPAREKQIIYRCDACFGGELDYELLEDLRRHRLLEHGQKMREKVALSKTNNNLEAPASAAVFPSARRRSAPKIRRCHSAVPVASASSAKKDNRSPVESVKNLRRSARVPKPSPALLQSLLDAKEMGKDFANLKGIGDDENDDNEAEPIVTIMKDGRIEVEDPDSKKAKKNAGEKRMSSPDALDAADSMLKLALTEHNKSRQNAKMLKKKDDLLKNCEEAPAADSTEVSAEKKRKCSTDVRPTLSVRQDDCTWFGHSVAASLRQMPIHTKELAKTRIQQVIYECTSPSVQEAVMDTGANVKEGSSHRIAGFEGVGKESFSLRSF
ncbi:hypothetical protein GPALN_008012 [Globodera pallida]|nr:hypothetical protein GPALN_008012 [Globodera pallida]